MVVRTEPLKAAWRAAYAARFLKVAHRNNPWFFLPSTLGEPREHGHDPALGLARGKVTLDDENGATKADPVVMGIS